MANVSIISQAHVSELSLHNPRHSTTKYSWVYVLLSENRHIFFKTDHLGFYALQWSVSLRCTVSQARTRRLILMEQRVGRERGGFLEAALVLPPPPPASRRRWHGAEQQEEGARSEWDQPKQWCPQLCSEEGQHAIFFYIGPDLISTEHKSQSGLKELQETKPFYARASCFLVLFFLLFQ